MKEGRRMQELCLEQREEILSLKHKLAERAKQLASLSKLISKYSAVIPELAKLQLSLQTTNSVVNSPGNEYWSQHFPSAPGSNLSFGEIAAKGLWVTSSKPTVNRQNRRLSAYGTDHQSESLPEIPIQDRQIYRKNQISMRKGTYRERVRQERRVSEGSGDYLPAIRPAKGHY
jgi:hypothetical protein